MNFKLRLVALLLVAVMCLSSCDVLSFINGGETTTSSTTTTTTTTKPTTTKPTTTKSTETTTTSPKLPTYEFDPSSNSLSKDELVARYTLTAEEVDAAKVLLDEMVELSKTAETVDPVNEKYEDAFAWFSNAAVAGHPRAQYMTGFMLMQGQGTNRSVPLATEYFEKAALQEDSLAQYVLGQIFWKGLGVPADKKKGRKWLEQAASNGNPAAEAFLESIK